MVWYELEWYGMVWYELEWYDGIGMEVIPLWNGVPSRFTNSKNWTTS